MLARAKSFKKQVAQMEPVLISDFCNVYGRESLSPNGHNINASQLPTSYKGRKQHKILKKDHTNFRIFGRSNTWPSGWKAEKL